MSLHVGVIEGGGRTSPMAQNCSGEKEQPKRVFVQANTFLVGNELVLREYEATCEGVGCTKLGGEGGLRWCVSRIFSCGFLGWIPCCCFLGGGGDNLAYGIG